MANQARSNGVEKFLRMMGHDPIYSCNVTARVNHEESDELVLTFVGCGPDDAYVGVCIITDSKFEFTELVYMNSELKVVTTSDETPMANPWEESVAEFDEASAEVVRNFIGAY